MTSPSESPRLSALEKGVSEKRLMLEERAQTLYLRAWEFRHTFPYPSAIPESYFTLMNALGTFTYQGPGLPGTNAPHKYLEEYTTEEIGDSDRKDILSKLEYSNERKSVSARLDRARTMEELEKIENELGELETTFAALEHKDENKAA